MIVHSNAFRTMINEICHAASPLDELHERNPKMIILFARNLQDDVRF